MSKPLTPEAIAFLQAVEAEAKAAGGGKAGAAVRNKYRGMDDTNKNAALAAETSKRQSAPKQAAAATEAKRTANVGAGSMPTGEGDFKKKGQAEQAAKNAKYNTREQYPSFKTSPDKGKVLTGIGKAVGTRAKSSGTKKPVPASLKETATKALAGNFLKTRKVLGTNQEQEKMQQENLKKYGSIKAPKGR